MEYRGTDAEIPIRQVALELLDSLPFSRLAADAQSCTALLTACGQAVAWEVALETGLGDVGGLCHFDI